MNYYSNKITVQVAATANLVSFFAFVSAYIFSCKLVSWRSDKKISNIQRLIFAFLTAHAIIINFIPGMVIKGVAVEDVGKFTISFGRFSAYFFFSLVVLLVLTFRNFYIYKKKSLRLEQMKSSYMIFGVIIFMISTVISHLIIPIFYKDFSLVWLPPMLSVFESLLVGYALLFNRFYSLRYISFIGASYIVNCFIYIIPLYLFKKMIGATFDTWIFLLITVFIIGNCWPKSLKFVKALVSRILYGMVGNPVENIFNLAKDFQLSSEKAIYRLNFLLGTSEGKIKKIGHDSASQVFMSYFEKEKVIIKDEIEYLMQTKGVNDVNAVSIINKKMEDGGMALILPIFEKDNKISHIYTVSNKNGDGCFSSEEISALQSLFGRINQYIYAEDKVRISQVLAGSIAHEIRNPLTKIKHHFETIDADIFGGDDTAQYKPLPENMKKIYKEVVGGKNAVQLGTKFIDVMLGELQGAHINQASFRYFSARNLTVQSLEEFNFRNESERNRVRLLSSDDFIFKGSNTSFSFIIFNLLKNSLYYFDDYKESCIEIKLIPGRGCNKISFRDTGPGIDKNIIGYIFDEFFTLGKTNGNGLGLPYCRRVMAAFKGDISCESILGKFTEFTLTFPVVSEDVIIENTTKKLKSFLSNKDCLIIGDHEAIEEAKRFLLQLGMNVVNCTNTEQALESLTEEVFDFIYICNHAFEKEYELLKSIRTELFDVSVRVVPIIRLLSNNKSVNLHSDNYITQGFIDARSGWKHFILALDELLLAGCLNSLGSLANKRVLIVDDVKTNRMLVQHYLQANGIVTMHAENGKVAIEMVQDDDYDLILMDIQMPIMNGIDATKSIRRTKNNFPIIALTGDESKSILDDINNYMDDYIMKPVSRRQLQGKLYKWIQSAATNIEKTESTLQ